MLIDLFFEDNPKYHEEGFIEKEEYKCDITIKKCGVIIEIDGHRAEFLPDEFEAIIDVFNKVCRK